MIFGEIQRAFSSLMNICWCVLSRFFLHILYYYFFLSLLVLSWLSPFHDRTWTRNAIGLKKFFTSVLNPQRGLLLKIALNRAAAAAAEGCLFCCNQHWACWELRLQREIGRPPPWGGSLYMPRWLSSQDTHKCLTGEILDFINITSTL